MYLSLLYDVLCSLQLSSVVDQPFTNDVSPANCSGDNNGISRVAVFVSADSASDVVESHLSCQNNVANLSEESVTQNNDCSHVELVEDGSVDGETLTVPSTMLQRMKRAGSLPSTLLWYVSQRYTSRQKYIHLKVSLSFLFYHFLMLS